ncbi:hypothetical protein [Nocardia iowensis]|uniref:Integral membrane protein n=1 Tax=Nocardia iowensis TaxID=204891 RepID=A0ABX8RNT3_NOCIO|nr:hypothetical protein [Nocardia iowensis]QXN90559.1 hypothetical protein KV110_35080 [Nocardia iowensis]QXN93331.1 hypothetical protein KV110_09710 [Nocardia iowensis]
MTTTTAPSYLSTLMAPGPALLRLSLRLDAVITTVNGLAYLALAGPLESLLGLDTAIGIPIGIFLTLYGLAVALIGTRPTINPTATRLVIAANTTWVLASLTALFITDTLDLNLIGSIWTVMQAGTVGGFAALQYLGLRKAQ